MQTSHKAWGAAGSTFVMVLLAVFGLGAMPTPETIGEAVTVSGAAIITAAATWVTTYFTANRNK